MKEFSNERTRSCIIPADRWDGDTGIDKLLDRYRDENPDLYYSEVNIRAAHSPAKKKGIDY